MVAAITYEIAEDERFARAIVDLINTDAAKFEAYFGGRARWCRPTIDDSMIENPDCIVQIGVPGATFNRQIGGTARPTHVVTVTLWEDPAAEPYDVADVNKPERLLNHFEKLLEAGSFELPKPTDPNDPDYAADMAAYLASRNGKGWLVDPDSAYGNPATARYLNSKPPDVTRMAPQIRMSEAREDGVSVALSTVYPVIVTYEAFVDRLTRRRT